MWLIHAHELALWHSEMWLIHARELGLWPSKMWLIHARELALWAAICGCVQASLAYRVQSGGGRQCWQKHHSHL
jgi:hypothetical protein